MFKENKNKTHYMYQYELSKEFVYCWSDDSFRENRA